MHRYTERLTWLVLDNETRRLSENADLRLGYGLCGALMLDLMQEKALIPCADESLRPGMATNLNGYLQYAFDLLPSHTSCSRLEVMKALYSAIPHLKALVLDEMVSQAMVREDTADLQWEFSLKSYVLKKSATGYRSQIFNDMLKDSISHKDFCVLQLAMASHLLWAEATDEKLLVKNVMSKITHYTMMHTETLPLLSLISDALPQAIVVSHKLPRMKKKSTYPLIWEWRGFWEDTGATLIQSSEIYNQALENISFSETKDCYLIVQGMAENIKLRKCSLEVKRPQETLNGFTAYSPKECYSFPLASKKIQQLFPALTVPDKAFKNMQMLQRCLDEHDIGYQLIQVLKKRFQVKLQSEVKVELCTLQLADKRFLSICVEGPDYDITAAHSHNFQSDGVMMMNYVEFLKHYQMEFA
ncbi:MAG: hypothetical protein MK052_03115 [Alphaproteobacteria bacterium]|nr:hypothetical protein [Alphaproteobacteria bacterium]